MSRLSLGGLASGMDTDNMIEQLMKVQRYKVDRYKKRNMSNDYRQEEWKKMNTKIYSFFNKSLTSVRLKSSLIKNKAVSSNATTVDAQATATAQKGTHELEVLALAKTASTASGKLVTTQGTEIASETTMQDMGLAGKSFAITYKDKQGTEQTITVTADATDTLRGFVDKIKNESKGKLDVEANLDLKNGRLFLATKNSGEKQSFRLSGDIATTFGFSTTEIKGQDAKYLYNGTEFTAESNEVEINGLKLTLRSLGKATVSVSRDVDGAYKQIVDFLKQYNALVTEMQDKVNVTVRRSERDMEPLTDQEKKGLSEADVKKWEEKLRGRVFKRDKNLKEILSDMRTIFATTTVSGNGKYDALSTLGISTGDYKLNTGAVLFVDGDSELGGGRSERPNKLRQAIEEDPEAVAELVSNLAQKLSDKLADKMKSTTLRSYMSFYDDKAAKEEYRQVERRIQIMEDRLVSLEEKYRKQFAAMEKALSKSNSTSNWLAQQLGGKR